MSKNDPDVQRSSLSCLQHRKRVGKLGNLCAFYETPVPESDLAMAGSSGQAYVKFQSAANPAWYLGFGPYNAARGRHRNWALTPDGYEVLLARRMSTKASGSLRTDKCDFKFSTGPYAPDNMYGDMYGLRLRLEQNQIDRMRHLQSNTISGAPNDVAEDQDDNFDFDRKSSGRNRFPASNVGDNELVSLDDALLNAKVWSESDKISASSEDDVTPLPSPLAMRKRKTKKFRRKPTRPSYFYDHNRRRDDSNRPSSDVVDQLDSITTPLFSSLV
jgi:hypothetical protein